ncbi:3-demethylubiquinone-9 3-methyltransferase [compost metagenome]
MDHGVQFDEGISIVVTTKDQEETDYYWNTFTSEGEESMCGWLKDRYGISWQITPARLLELMADPDREKAGRVMQAMMKMRKIVIADLEAAYAGA